MTTTTAAAGVPTSRYTLQLIERVQQSIVPAGLPAGVRLTLLADRERALRAAEDADMLATGDTSWDQDYPEAACELFPQDAAAERATRAADDEWAAFSRALAMAATAVTR